MARRQISQRGFLCKKKFKKNEWKTNNTFNGSGNYGCPNGKVVDHIDHDTLDNQRINLRICTRSQNGMNRKKDSGIKFKGVTFHKRAGKFMAQIYMNGKKYYLGVFETPEEAAMVYDKKARELHGEFALTNF